MAAPDFSEPVKRAIRHRASYICSNPNCKQPTLLPSSENEDEYIMDGEVAHIKDAREKTQRFDEKMSDDERASISNGLYLCAKCHTEIDKNKGADYPVELLEKWKKDHHDWLISVHHERMQGISENTGTTVNIKDSVFAHKATVINKKVETPLPQIKLEKWDIQNQTVREIQIRRQKVTLPTNEIKDSSLIWNQFHLSYISEIARNTIVFRIKRKDVVVGEIKKVGRLMSKKVRTKEGWFVYVLQQPENGIYIIDLYTKLEIKNILAVLDCLK